MNFIEELSCVFGKQYLFKQSKDNYYNRYLNLYQSKRGAKDWLIDMFTELNNDNLDSTSLEKEQYTGYVPKKSEEPHSLKVKKNTLP